MDLTDLLKVMPDNMFYEYVSLYDVYSNLDYSKSKVFVNALLDRKSRLIRQIKENGGEDYLLENAKYRCSENFSSLFEVRQHYRDFLNIGKGGRGKGGRRRKINNF